MTVEDKINQWYKEIIEILNENVDIQDEQWFNEINNARMHLSTALTILKKSNNQQKNEIQTKQKN